MATLTLPPEVPERAIALSVPAMAAFHRRPRLCAPAGRLDQFHGNAAPDVRKSALPTIRSARDTATRGLEFPVARAGIEADVGRPRCGHRRSRRFARS